MKIFIADDYDGLYGKFWGQLGTILHDEREFMKDPESFDLVCFTGGADVSPSLYGHENLGSSCNESRDKHEVLIFEMAYKYGIPMAGICRGTQLLCVMCGGTMIQHLKRSHGGGSHCCVTSDGQEFQVTSSHHQVCIPSAQGTILAWAKTRLAFKDIVYGGSDINLNRNIDPHGKILISEAIYYPNFKVFGVQFHPEWMDIDCKAAEWTLDKIRKLLIGEGTRATAAEGR